MAVIFEEINNQNVRKFSKSEELFRYNDDYYLVYMKDVRIGREIAFIRNF